MSTFSDDDIRLDDDYSHFRQFLQSTPEIDTLHETPSLFLQGVKIIPKASQSAIIPDHKAQLLRHIGNAQSEINRLNKLMDEIRADVLHLTVE